MTRLTKVELESIRKRVDAATPGPWYVDVFGDEVRSNESDLSVAYDITNEANAEFIAHAREDIPKLLAEIERLQQEKDEWYEKYMRLDATVSTQYKQLEKANAEIERLNDVIKQLTETTESFLDDKRFYMDELKKTEEALREIDTHIRATSGPVPYIIETLKRVLPEYNENEGDRV